jgi:hypothetical protein
MKKLNCFSSVPNNTGSAHGFRFGGKSGTAVISGLLISSLLAVGCSKEKSTPASSETQTSANQTTLNQPVSANQMAATVPATVPVQTTKKVVKKRPSAVTYKDQTYGVSFRYPRKYALKTGDDLDSKSVPMDFVQPGGVSAVAVELPKDLYPNTDLASAFFLVNVNKSVTEAECGQFAVPQPIPSDKGAVQPSKMALGGLEMQEVEDISGEDMKQADTKYYHLFQNSACYEFALGLWTEAVGDDETVAPVDREKVFRRLETILATVKIKPVTDSHVATDAATAPSSQTSTAVSTPPLDEVAK